VSIVGLVEQPNGKGRWYEHPLTGDRYESVTHILGAGLSKPWLAPWAAKLAARSAVERQAEWLAILAADGPEAAITWLAAEAKRLRELKADIGSYVHHVIEALLLGAPIPGIPEHLNGVWVDGELIDQEWLDLLIDGWLNFYADHDPDTICAEATVADDELKVAGTLDWLGRLPKTRFADLLLGIDAKTGKHLDVTYTWQAEAYRRMPFLWLPEGRIARKPIPERFLILHIRGEYERGYKLIPMHTGDAEWGAFLACRDILRAEADAPPIEHELPVYPLLPDGSEPPVLIEDVYGHPGYRRYVTPLRAAGLRTLEDVAQFGPADLRQIKGLGEKAPDVLAGLLALHGLSFASEMAVA
jgi:hypothetical protein